MSIRFDEKGKFFTDIVSKEAIWVNLQTLTHRIYGRLHVRPGERLKDEINQAEDFIAITEATVFDSSGNALYHSKFIAVNRLHIIWILPEEQSNGGGA